MPEAAFWREIRGRRPRDPLVCPVTGSPTLTRREPRPRRQSRSSEARSSTMRGP